MTQPPSRIRGSTGQPEGGYQVRGGGANRDLVRAANLPLTDKQVRVADDRWMQAKQKQAPVPIEVASHQ